MSKLNPALKDFWRKKARNRVLYGGRASSKSWDAAGWAIFLSTRLRLRILCCRQFQSKITESVYTLLKSTIHRWGLQNDFRILNNSIINIHTGSEFLFYGLWRHIDEVKSLEGIDICWIEEAHNLTQEQWEILNPTIRKEGSEFWIIFNPRLITDFVYKRFVTNTPEDTIKHKINYIDNPFLSHTMLKVIEGAKAEDEDDYTHIYLGEPKMDDEESVIQRSHVMAAIDAHIKLNINIRGRKTIGFDVADAGEDYNASISSHGSLAYHLDCWKGKEDELLKSCGRVWSRAREDGSMIKYDAIGVGASAGAQFNVLNQQNSARVTHQKFFAGGAPNKPDSFYKLTNIKNRDFFSNIKAQAWWELADRFRNTYNAVKNGQKFRDDEMIFIDSNLDKLDQLIDELCTPKRDFDLAGRVKVESKKDLAKRDIASPNCFVAGTMIATDRGQVRIELLNIGDSVLTPMGYSKITHLHRSEADVITKFGLKGTADHKIFTWNKGWVSLQMLSSCDKIEPLKIGGLKWRLMNLLYTKAKCSQFSTQVDIIAQEGMAERTMEMKGFYTEGFGLSITAKFLQNTTSTILTVIGGITELKILIASRVASIRLCICAKGLKAKSTEQKTNKTSTKQEKKPKNGISQMKVENGIVNMPSYSLARESLKDIFASYVARHFFPEKHTHLAHAQDYALQKEQTKRHQNSLNQIVDRAERNLNIQSYLERTKTKDAQGYALMQSSATVYNITLEEHNVYYANGILVKNCADAFVMAFVDTSSGGLF